MDTHECIAHQPANCALCNGAKEQDTGHAVIVAAEAHIRALAHGNLNDDRTRRALRRAVAALDGVRQVFATTPAQEQGEIGDTHRRQLPPGLSVYTPLTPGNLMNQSIPIEELPLPLTDDATELPMTDGEQVADPVREQPGSMPETFAVRLYREIAPVFRAMQSKMEAEAERARAGEPFALQATQNAKEELELRRKELRSTLLQQLKDCGDDSDLRSRLLAELEET